MIFVLMKNKPRTHLIFWLIYFIFQVNSEYAYLDNYLPQHLQADWLLILWFAFVSILVFDLSIIPCFYFLLAIIDGKSNFLRSTASKIILSIAVIAFFVVIFRISCHSFVFSIVYKVEEDIDSFSLFGIFNALMNIGFGVSLALGMEKFRQQLVIQEELNELRTEKLSNEIKFLKTQINPHFLFNTLNNIYGLALKKSDDTPEVILKLAKIMRYNIYESGCDSVPLVKEIENLEDFIEINKIRHKNLSVDFEHSIDNTSQVISPLILLQFVENAFKHGASESVSASCLKIKLTLKEHILYYEVSNSVEVSHNISSTKIGLQNIKRQLELLYPDRHQLSIQQNNDNYTVILTIDFTHES
ncbi:sensor histidine kinase [Flavobacterium sp. H122]|uniref:sensor histidine kinase n=1 Tax=Flavobacterium sp. H122 TaxID=2529860 RepID=UPI0010A9FED4|nr:histidine kinase [Flavobacterium sp. H122]